MGKLIASKSVAKINKLIAKIDAQTQEVTGRVVAGKYSREDVDVVRHNIKELVRLYNGIKALIVNDNDGLGKIANDKEMADAVANMSVIATRLDILNDFIKACENEDEVTTDDILKEIGVENVEQEKSEISGEQENAEQEGEQEGEQEVEQENGSEEGEQEGEQENAEQEGDVENGSGQEGDDDNDDDDDDDDDIIPGINEVERISAEKKDNKKRDIVAKKKITVESSNSLFGNLFKFGNRK